MGGDGRTALDAAAKAVADECQAEDGELLAHIGTDNVARDLEALRIALGETGLTYVGFSYGTSIGLRYLALFPTKVRAMVVDGVVAAGSSAGVEAAASAWPTRISVHVGRTA